MECVTIINSIPPPFRVSIYTLDSYKLICILELWLLQSEHVMLIMSGAYTNVASNCWEVDGTEVCPMSRLVCTA